MSQASSIDVVIPARDSLLTLTATLCSLYLQNYGSFRVYLFDDASVESVEPLAHWWGELIDVSTIRVRDPIGPGAGRNAAAALGRSDLLCFVDSDDLVLSNHLTLHAQSYERGAPLTASTLLEYRPQSSDLLVANSMRVPAREEQWPRILRENFMPIATSIDRDWFERLGGFRQGVMEDWDLWIRAMAGGLRAVQLRTPTYLHRQTAGSRGASLSSHALKHRVLDLALLRAKTPRERRYIRSGRRYLDALLEMERAAVESAAGQNFQARRSAIRALKSPHLRTRMAACRRILVG